MPNQTHQVALKFFFETLASYSRGMEGMPAGLKDFLTENIKVRTYPKKHLLLHENQIPYNAWFITEGAARRYYYDEYLQREMTTWFWFRGEMIVPASLHRQLEADANVELLTDSVLLQITLDQIETLNSEYPEYRRIEQALTEDHHQRFIEHHRNVLHHPNRHRYAMLKEAHHEVFNLASLKDIASFLNMHPKSLSALRRQAGPTSRRRSP